MIVIRYNREIHENQWNSFVDESRQGTFILNRSYMEYHSNIFEDYSLLLYKNKKLIAVMPGNVTNGTFYSHQGLTYGGLIYSHQSKTSEIMQCFNHIILYLKQNQISRILYKRIPSIYHKIYSDEDIYALFRCGFKLCRRDVGYFIRNLNVHSSNNLRKRCLVKSQKLNLLTLENNDYDAFYNLLRTVLLDRHNTKPVHSLNEMKYLSSKFPQNIKLICSYLNNCLVSGSWVFFKKNCIHTQYIATSEIGRNSGAFESIVNYIILNYPSYSLSFGISTEQNGLYLNEGLATFKESFGASAVISDFYELDLSTFSIPLEIRQTAPLSNLITSRI